MVIYKTRRRHFYQDIYNDASVRSVLHKSGVGGLTLPGIGPLYSAPIYRQRVHGIGNFFSRLFPWVHPLLWSGAKAVGPKTLHTFGKILTDIAER